MQMIQRTPIETTTRALRLGTLLVAATALLSANVGLVSRAQTNGQQMNVAIALPQINSGGIDPLAFADRLTAALAAEGDIRARVLENAVGKDMAREMAAREGFDFLLLTTVDAKEKKSIAKRATKFLKRVPGIGKKKEEDSPGKYEFTVGYELLQADGTSLLQQQVSSDKAEIDDATARLSWQITVSVVGKMQEIGSTRVASTPGASQTAGPVSIGRSTGEPRLVVQTSHSTMVTDFVYSADARVLATLGADGVVKIWNTQSGKEIYTFAGEGIANICFPSGGKPACRHRQR